MRVETSRGSLACPSMVLPGPDRFTTVSKDLRPLHQALLTYVMTVMADREQGGGVLRRCPQPQQKWDL